MRREFVRFIRSLESRFLMPLWKILFEVLSAMTLAKRINSPLPLTDLLPMNGIRHLREIKEITPKSIFRKVIKQLDLSDWMNLTNSLSVQTPDLVSSRDPTIQTYNVGDQRSGGVATRIANKYGIWEPTLSNIKILPTHGDIIT